MNWPDRKLAENSQWMEMLIFLSASRGAEDPAAAPASIGGASSAAAKQWNNFSSPFRLAAAHVTRLTCRAEGERRLANARLSRLSSRRLRENSIRLTDQPLGLAFRSLSSSRVFGHRALSLGGSARQRRQRRPTFAAPTLIWAACWQLEARSSPVKREFSRKQRRNWRRRRHWQPRARC